MGSGLEIFAESWINARRGPVFTAMFQPLRTVIVTFLAYMFLQEQIHIGRQVKLINLITTNYYIKFHYKSMLNFDTC